MKSLFAVLSITVFLSNLDLLTAQVNVQIRHDIGFMPIFNFFKSYFENHQSSRVEKLLNCVNFATLKHSEQRRKDKLQSPFINHPIGVAHILSNEAKITDINVLQAALLHDVVEDTNTTLDEILEKFGENVKKIVAEVTDNKNIPKKERRRQQIERAQKLSHDAKLVKLADKLQNLRELDNSPPIGWSKEWIREYFIWCKKIIEAGLRGTNKYLEVELDKLFKKHHIYTSQV